MRAKITSSVASIQFGKKRPGPGVLDKNCMQGALVCCFRQGMAGTSYDLVRKARDTFNFLRHAMRTILSVRPQCSHKCVSVKGTPLKPVQILKHTTKNSAEQTAMRTKCFKQIAI